MQCRRYEAEHNRLADVEFTVGDWLLFFFYCLIVITSYLFRELLSTILLFVFMCYVLLVIFCYSLLLFASYFYVIINYWLHVYFAVMQYRIYEYEHVRLTDDQYIVGYLLLYFLFLLLVIVCLLSFFLLLVISW